MADSIGDEITRLTERFRQAGAPEPEEWASSEVRQGIAQLARFTFLRSVWPDIINTWLDAAWIDEWISAARAQPTGPFADAGLALQRMRENGIAPIDVSSVARATAYAVVFAVLYKVGYGADKELDDEYPGWRLMELDLKSGELTGRDVGALYESVLSLDPTGREGRPA